MIQCCFCQLGMFYFYKIKKFLLLERYKSINMIKIPPKQSIVKTKREIFKIKNTFQAVADFRPIRFIIDVDAY